MVLQTELSATKEIYFLGDTAMQFQFIFCVALNGTMIMNYV
jgi:hypothetical protein